MKKAPYQYFILATLLSILSFHSFASDKPRIPDSTKQIKWLHKRFKNISPATSTKRDIKSFMSIKSNWTLEKIISTVGFPDYDIGSGISIFVYEQSDNTKVWVGFINIEGNPIYVTHIKSKNEQVQLLSN